MSHIVCNIPMDAFCASGTLICWLGHLIQESVVCGTQNCKGCLLASYVHRVITLGFCIDTAKGYLYLSWGCIVLGDRGAPCWMRIVAVGTNSGCRRASREGGDLRVKSLPQDAPGHDLTPGAQPAKGP